MDNDSGLELSNTESDADAGNNMDIDDDEEMLLLEGES
jgi:hypothetical protein